ncbi:MAG: HD domain-containing protein [Bacilli bacterium]|nr:HD domain-containing protein [Bacilli bacterium]
MSISDKIEYYQIINEILDNNEFQKRKTYKHHGNITVYEHSLAVSKLSYIMAKKIKKDYKVAAISGLLHDFYTEPWQEIKEKKPLFEKHGFVHAAEAKKNSQQHFASLMNNKIENSIQRHMFPLNKIPPKYIEGWIVMLADKYISLEVFLNPKCLPRLLGFKRKIKEN